MENVKIATPVVTKNEDDDGLQTWYTCPVCIKHISDELEITSILFINGVEIGDITHGFSSGYTCDDEDVLHQVLKTWIDQRDKKA